MAATTRAFVYVRISELTDATTSPERQLADCTAYAERAGWEVVGSFDDLDISGTKDLRKRPGLASALEAIEAGEADVLLAAKIDRVARSVITFNEVVRRLDDAGGALVSVAEGLDFSSPAGRMVANVLATFAQFESETIGARVASAKRHLKEAGKWPGGRRPFGWSPVPHESGKGYTLALDAKEGPVLREMAARVLDGEPVAAIAADLNRRGISTVLGKAWVGETVRKALVKRTVMGEGGAEALLDERTFAKLLRRLERGAPRRTVDRDPPLIPPEVLTCGACGAPMRPATRKDRKRTTRVYRCSSRPAPGTKGGCFVTASMEGVDEAVSGLLTDMFGRLPTAAVAEPEMIDPAAEERAELATRMDELEQDRYVRGLFSGAEGASRFERIYGDLERRLADLPAPYMDQEARAVTIPTGDEFEDAWFAADIEERRAWIIQAVARIEVAKGSGGRRFDPDRVTLALSS